MATFVRKVLSDILKACCSSLEAGRHDVERKELLEHKLAINIKSSGISSMNMGSSYHNLAVYYHIKASNSLMIPLVPVFADYQEQPQYNLEQLCLAKSYCKKALKISIDVGNQAKRMEFEELGQVYLTIVEAFSI